MQAYIIRRLLLIIPTVVVATMIIFFAIRLIPGSIIDQMLTEHVSVSEESVESIKHALGLDVPVYVQYGRWLGNIFLHGDLGNSLWKGVPVAQQINKRVPVTSELAIMATIMALVIALPIGVYSAIRQDTAGDYIGRSFGILCISVPGFWLGTMVMVFPSLWWGWSPSIDLIKFGDDPLGNIVQFIIPATVLGMALSGVMMRMTRTTMLEVLRQDYIRTAWSKGLTERTIVISHSLKNALIPVVTIVGTAMPVLIGGTVIIEQIFCLPGIGRLIVEAAFQRDYPVIVGAMLFFALVILIINLVVDLTYAYMDPRIHY